MAKNWRKAPPVEVTPRRAAGGGDLLFGGGDDLRDTVALRLSDVLPNPEQPRRFFDLDELNNLAASLRTVGQLAPILVKRSPSESRRFILVAGERRWRAAEIAGLPTVAAHILSDDSDIDQVALIENLQRVNLSPIEEAEGVRRLIDRHGYSQEQAGALLGRSRTEINTTLSLLRLHPTIRDECVTSHVQTPKALLLEVARMPAAEQLTAWSEVKTGGATARGLRAARQGEGGDKPPKPSSSSSSSSAAAGDWGRLGRALRQAAAQLRAARPPATAAEREELAHLRVYLSDCAGALDALIEKIE